MMESPSPTEMDVVELADFDELTPAWAIAMLELAAQRGAPAWERLIVEDHLAALESLLASPEDKLAGYEQELYAPAEMGLRDRAMVLIEALGHQQARSGGVGRDTERLLHAAGEPKAAYRIEHVRRSFHEPKPARAPIHNEPWGPLIVAVAGGHPRLRKMIRKDLARLGVEDLREIPSAFEASRVGRDVAAKLSGADLVVLIVSQIAHSTSDQVLTASERLGLAVAYSHSAGIAGVRRSVEAYAREHSEKHEGRRP